MYVHVPDVEGAGDGGRRSVDRVDVLARRGAIKRVGLLIFQRAPQRCSRPSEVCTIRYLRVSEEFGPLLVRRISHMNTPPMKRAGFPRTEPGRGEVAHVCGVFRITCEENEIGRSPSVHGPEEARIAQEESVMYMVAPVRGIPVLAQGDDVCAVISGSLNMLEWPDGGRSLAG